MQRHPFSFTSAKWLGLSLVPVSAAILGAVLISGRASAQTPSVAPKIVKRNVVGADIHTLREIREHQTDLTRLVASLKSTRRHLLALATKTQGAASWLYANLGDSPEEFAKAKKTVLTREEALIQSLRTEINDVSIELAEAREDARGQHATRARYAAELTQWRSGRATRPWAFADDAPEPPIGIDLDGEDAERQAIATAEGRLRTLRQRLALHQDSAAYWRGFTFNTLCSIVGDGYHEIVRNGKATSAKVALLDDAISSLEEQSRRNKSAMRMVAFSSELDATEVAKALDEERKACVKSRSELAEDLAEARKETDPALRQEAVIEAVGAFIEAGMPVDLGQGRQFSTTVESLIRDLASTEAPLLHAKQLAYLSLQP